MARSRGSKCRRAGCLLCKPWKAGKGRLNPNTARRVQPTRDWLQDDNSTDPAQQMALAGLRRYDEWAAREEGL